MNVSQWALLASRMFRHPVPFLMLIPFFLGVASSGIDPSSLLVLLEAAALAVSYIVATCVNDIYDRKIDEVNYPNHDSRPLVNGTASVIHLWILQTGVASASLAASFYVGVWEGVLMTGLLVVYYAYSVPPLRISRFPIASPVLLTAGYVLFPFLLGADVSVRAFRIYPSVPLVAGICILFFGRILLKDFRDRRGDAQYGKHTFLLTYGKRTTCIVSAAATGVGALLLGVHVYRELNGFWFAAPGIGALALAQVLATHALWKAHNLDMELAAIYAISRSGIALSLVILGLSLFDTRSDIFGAILFSLGVPAVFIFDMVGKYRDAVKVRFRDET